MLSKKEARRFAYDLILDRKRCITELTDSDKENLASLLIESTDKYHAHEYIGDADSHNELPYLLAAYMRRRDPETAQSLLDTLVNNAVKFAGNEIVDILLEQEQEYEFDKKYEISYLK